MREISIVLPNQLFRSNPLFNLKSDFLLMEDSLFFGNDKSYQYINHKNKLILLKASMIAYKEYLIQKGIKVKYLDNKPSYSLTDYLSESLEKKYQVINIINPHDHLIMGRLKRFCKKFNIRINVLESPMFLTSVEIRDSFNLSEKKPLMGRFYENQRKEKKILLDSENQPLGGKWSFDELNRNKLPKNIKVPDLKKLTKNKFVLEAEKIVFEGGLKYRGSSDFFIYPTTFEEAEHWLDLFLEERFSLFGDYEDAISKKHKFLWHSVLSPILNIGLLTPNEVIKKAISFNERKNIPINSLEGFIRQIIGWREFMCLVYEKYGVKMRTTNFWDFEYKSIPNSFYNATTGIEPVDTVIKNIIDFGYCHHIERLMIMGNFMLLCRIHPDEVYKWFMEMFVDSYDWVMVPNVYGMSQFSDGGIFSTKPYISSSNYIKKMSDYKNGEWTEIWDGLFWKFIKDYQNFFRNQYRLSMMARNLDKMDPLKLERHNQIANQFLNNLS